MKYFLINSGWNIIAHALKTLFKAGLVSAFFVSGAYADIQKFVFVFDKQGTLLTPLNVANECPDPNGDSTAAQSCQGVLVNADGEYLLRLASDVVVDKDKIFLVANTYNVNNAGQPDVSYVLMESKRRAEKIDKDKGNKGSDINHLSEAALKALEKTHNVQKEKVGSVSKELIDNVADDDVEAINDALGNGRRDNDDGGDVEKKRAGDRLALLLEDLEGSEEDLVALATLAVENANDPRVLAYIRKNVGQLIAQPALVNEIGNRVFSHVAGMQLADSGQALVMLDADKYTVYPNDSISLDTSQSLNPGKFFGYTWDGVASELSTATFVKDRTGSFLVCVTGEGTVAVDTSTDCVRLAIKDEVDAIARASLRRVGTGNTMKLSGSLSVGATSFSWTGPGTFTSSTTEATQWTAPSVPGEYQIQLGINNNEDTDTVTVSVFGVLPVAIAQAEPSVVYLENQTAIVSLASGSIATDGSDVDSLSWQVTASPPGSMPTISPANSKLATFTTETVGEYTIELIADKNGSTDVTELTIEVRQVGAPVANAGRDVKAFRNQPVPLDGSRSYAAPGKVLTYVWEALSGLVSNSNSQRATYVATTLGQFPVSLTVSDDSQSDTDEVIVSVVNQVPVASDDVVANLLNEIIYESVVSQDGDKDVLTYELLTQPANGGVTMNTTTGDYVYMPGGVKGCKYSPTAKPSANDGGGHDVPVIKLCADNYVVAVGDVINLTTSNSIKASRLSGFEWLNGAVADPNDIRKATYTGTEAGFHKICVIGNVGQSNNTSTACIDVLVSGNPGETLDDNAETGYIEEFHYRVNDGFDPSGDGIIKITIGWMNEVPQVDNINLTTDEEVVVSGQMTGRDADDHALQYRIVSNGSLGSLVLSDASSGTFSYTPNINVSGIDTVTYVANDGLEDSLAGVITITINNINDVPLAFYTGVLTTDEDVAVTGQLGGQDADGDVLEYRLATIPRAGDITSLNAQTGAFTYTPHKDKNGTDEFYFVVHDGTILSNTARVSITLNPVNDLPLTQDQGPLTVHADTVFNGQLQATDVDEDILVYELVALPQKGKVVLDRATGKFTFTATDSLQRGADQFTFVVNDGTSQSAVATVTLSIIDNNQPPVAVNQSITVFEGIAYGGVLAGSDPEGSSLSFKVEGQGRLGNTEINNVANGAFIYRPTSNASGKDYFTFTVSDGDKTSNTATVDVTIIPNSVSCAGPGHTKVDANNNGYSDYVELTVGSGNLPVVSANLNFLDDDDVDSFGDITELWLGSNHLDALSKPTASTLREVPGCLSVLYDSVAPVLQAFTITTPALNVSSGTAVAGFVANILDNASGVHSLQFQLVSPSGQIVKVKVVDDNNPLMLSAVFDSETFSQYAEVGIWRIDNFTITDALGNQVTLSTDNLKDYGYLVEISVSNDVPDITAPVLSLTDGVVFKGALLDLTGGPAKLMMDVTATDDISGIARIDITLKSSVGGVLMFAHDTVPGAPLSISARTVSSEVFSEYAEQGDWVISQLDISDVAGNLRSYTESDFAGLVCPVISNGPNLMELVSLEALTNPVDNNTPGYAAKFNVVVTSPVGIKNVELELIGPDSTGKSTIINTTSELSAGILSVDFFSEAYSSLDNGVYRFEKLTITDNIGTVWTWDAAAISQIMSGVNSFTVNIVSGRCILPIPKVYSPSFNTQEDVPLSGSIVGTDFANGWLIYSIVGKPSKGTFVFTDVTTGAFTYTPNANLYGSDSVSVQVENRCGRLSSASTVSFNVSSEPDATTVDDMVIEVEVDSSVSSNLSAHDTDGLPLTYVLETQPALGVISNFDALTGAFVYTPNPGLIVPVTDSFTYFASDSNSTSLPATVTINITPFLKGFDVLYDPVSIHKTYVDVGANVTLSLDISTIEAAYVSIIGPSQQVIIVNKTLTATAYPFALVERLNTSVDVLEVGTWKFANLYIKRKGQALYELVVSDIGAVGFTDVFEGLGNHQCLIGSPVRTFDSTYLGKVVDNDLLATDSDNDVLTYRITGSPVLGTVILDETTGHFSYFPPAKITNGITVDSFTYAANDGLEDCFGTAEFHLTFPEGHVTAYEEVFKYKLDVAVVDKVDGYDVDGHPLTYMKVSEPQTGTVTINSNTGEFVYRPNKGSKATDSFQFKVNDGIADSNVATVVFEFGNTAPVAEGDVITVFEDVTYNGAFIAHDADGDVLSYHLKTFPTKGVVTLDAATGAYQYVPNPGALGLESFKFVVSDGRLTSNTATISINIRQVTCGTSGAIGGLDSDGDGYIDYVETALGTDPNDVMVSPQDVSAVDFATIFKDDDDADGFLDYIELWWQRDPADAQSVPEYIFSECHNPISDGIKPQLVGLNIEDPDLDVSQGDTSVSLAFSLLDNASGIRRIRVSLRSPSDVFMTVSQSFDTAPVVMADRMQIDGFNEFSEAGTWEISGITIYDNAGNRLTLVTSDLVDAGMPTTINVTNGASDADAPTLVDFQILSTDVDVLSGNNNDTMRVQLTVADLVSGVLSVRVDFISLSGQVVSASQTLAEPSVLPLTVVSLETAKLSRYQEEGVWTVYSILLVDAAGNSAQVVDELIAKGLVNTLLVTNPDSDITPPLLESLSVLTPEVYPVNGDAKMRFGVTLSDDAAGIAKVELVLEGPSGQVKILVGEYHDSIQQPRNTLAQVESETLNTLTEVGVWRISFIEVTDDAGNTGYYDQVDLQNQGYPVDVTVRY